MPTQAKQPTHPTLHPPLLALVVPSLLDDEPTMKLAPTELAAQPSARGILHLLTVLFCFAGLIIYLARFVVAPPQLND